MQRSTNLCSCAHDHIAPPLAAHQRAPDLLHILAVDGEEELANALNLDEVVRIKVGEYSRHRREWQLTPV